MYKAKYHIPHDCLPNDNSNQSIFAPFLQCYYTHGINIIVNGMTLNDVGVVKITDYWAEWQVQEADFHLDKGDNVVFEIDYFYMRPDNTEVLAFLIDSSDANLKKTKNIISSHYVQGQFALDNGLYKSAVLSFGTTLEGLLNKELKYKKLSLLIDGYKGSADKQSMHFIRELRNKVHPEKIEQTEDVTRQEAISAREHLEVILKKMHDDMIEI